ncbi:hypothetical protein Cp4445_01280 [Clostridium perfringens]|nr:hypothetical protein [Clostridium perfringens]
MNKGNNKISDKAMKEFTQELKRLYYKYKGNNIKKVS